MTRKTKRQPETTEEGNMTDLAMSINQRVDYLSALIRYDLTKHGKISSYIKVLVSEDFKLTQDEWDQLEETRKFIIEQATQRFRESLLKE